MGCCQSDTVVAKERKPKEYQDYDTFELQYSDAPNRNIGTPTRNHGAQNPQGGRPAMTEEERRSPAKGISPSNNNNNNSFNMVEIRSRDEDLASTTNRSSHAGTTSLYTPLDQSLYAPSMASNASFAMSATNNIDNVTLDDVDKYVSHVKEGHDARIQSGSAASCAQEEEQHSFSLRAQVDACTTIADLELLEVMRRSELDANFTVTSKMILLAARRVVPVIRRKSSKRSTSSTSKTAVIMVHHRDLTHGGAEGAVDNSSVVSAQKTPWSLSITDSHSHTHIDPLNLGGSITTTSATTNAPPPTRTSTTTMSADAYGDETPLVAGGGHNKSQPPRTAAVMNDSLASRGESPPPEEDSPPVFALEGYSCMDIECDKKKFKPTPKAYNINGWDLFSEADATDLLNQGNVLFKFMCKTVKNLPPEDKAYIQPLVNNSAYKNEQEENNVPIIDLSDVENNGLWTIVCVKTCYMLPGLKLENITPELIGTNEYHTSCEPGPPKCEPYDPKYPNTVRMTLTFIKFVYSVLVMLRAAELKGEQAEKLEYLDGIVPAKVIIQERTKRNIAKSDGMVTVKSLLCYHPVTGGVLVSNTTVVVNRSVPRVIAPMVNTFGNQGAKDGAETAMLTRAYLLKKFGDSRQEMQVGEAPPPLAAKSVEKDKKGT